MIPPEVSRLLDAGEATRDAAWKRFVDTYSRLLLHTARSVNRDYDAAMDAYTHVLEQLRCDDFRRLRGYVADDRGKFTTWLVVVCRRLCVDFMRQRYGRLHEATQGSEQRAARRRLVDLVADNLDPSRLSHPAANPEGELRARQLANAMALALGDLEPRDRLLLRLRYDDELPAREIGTLMGFPTVFHVYRRLNAVLEQMRELLARLGVREPQP